MLVIDTSALVEVLTVDPAAIPELAGRVHDAEWMSAPSLVDYEVVNVLRRLHLRGDIDADLAEAARRTLRDLRLSRHPLTDDLTDRMWELRNNVSAYDASNVALAEHLDVPLVTVDGRLVEGLRGQSTAVIESYFTSG